MIRLLLWLVPTVFLAGAATAVVTAPLRMKGADERAASSSIGITQEALASLTSYRHRLYQVVTEDEHGEPYRLPWALSYERCGNAMEFMAKHGRWSKCEPRE